MLLWKKITSGYFLLNLKGEPKDILLQTLPFKLYVFPKNIKRTRILKFINQQKKQAKSKNYSFKNYFALDLVITTICNLRCTYCCALSKNTDFFYGLAPRHMSIKTAKKVISFVLSLFEQELIKEKNGNVARFDLFITGGEPLLNFRTVKFFLEQFDQKIKALSLEHKKQIKFDAEIATNGTLITQEIANIFKRFNVQVAITIDGPKHNKRRVFKDGRSSLPFVLKGIRLLIKNNNEIKLQAVVPINDISSIKGIFNFYQKKRLLEKIKRIHIVPEARPILDAYSAGKKERRFTISNYKTYAQTLIELAEKFSLDIKNYQGRLYRSIKIGGLPYRCAAGQWKISVTPNGDIYPCHQLTNIKEFYMGNVFMSCKQLENKFLSIKDLFRKRTVFKVAPCKNCVFQTTCIPFVDCPARCFLESGNLFKVPDHYCKVHRPYMKKLLEKFLLSKIQK